MDAPSTIAVPIYTRVGDGDLIELGTLAVPITTHFDTETGAVRIEVDADAVAKALGAS